MVPLLQNVKVLEIGTVVMAPYAGQILGDLGANVTKVEALSGDIARAASPHNGSTSALFAGNNRNKKSIAIDLASAKGRDIIKTLISQNDVVLHNLRAKAAIKLGLDFASAAAANPNVVYCATTGFGSAGRYVGRPAYDDVVQAASGLASLCSTSNGPAYVPTNLADKVAGLHAVYAILAAIIAQRNGNTQPMNIEVPMFEAVTAFLMNEHLGSATFCSDGKPGYPRILEFGRRPFKTRDGWICVIPYTQRQWQELLKTIGQEEISAEQWFIDPASRQSNLAQLYSIMEEALERNDTETWLEALTNADVPCSPINALQDVLGDPHLSDIGFFTPPVDYDSSFARVIPQPVIFNSVDQRSDIPPPGLGADTIDVLIASGVSYQDVELLVRDGTIKSSGN